MRFDALTRLAIDVVAFAAGISLAAIGEDPTSRALGALGAGVALVVMVKTARAHLSARSRR